MMPLLITALLLNMPVYEVMKMMLAVITLITVPIHCGMPVMADASNAATDRMRTVQLSIWM